MSSLITPESVLVVTGGAKGITSYCVTALARQFHCKFILIGRSPILPSLPEWACEATSEPEMKRLILEGFRQRGEKALPNDIQKQYHAIQSTLKIQNTLKEITNYGAQVRYLDVDITDAAILQSRLSGAIQELGPVSGLIHGAGSLADKVIEKKTLRDYDTVFGPKVLGLKNLIDCIPPKQLKFLVLFSSIVARYGNAGQADYAISNEILDKSARLIQGQNPGCRVLTINWGPWEGGMVTPELKKLFDQRNIKLISLETGAQTLIDFLMHPEPVPLQVVVGSPPLQPNSPMTTALNTYQIFRKLSLKANPFVLDHVIGDHPVLPATCGASWMAEGCEKMFPGFTFFSMQNYRILKGIVFDGQLSTDYTLEIQEHSKNEEEIIIDTRITSQKSEQKKLLHYSAQVTLRSNIHTKDMVIGDPPQIQNRADWIEGSTLYQDGTLFHGPAFQGVKLVSPITEDGLTMICNHPRVSDEAQGQFQVNATNPFMNDTIVQCLLIWSQFIRQAPCLPSFLQNFEQFRQIEFDKPFYVTLQCKVNLETSVVGDILAQDHHGNIYIRYTGLEGTISTRLKRLIGVKSI